MKKLHSIGIIGAFALSVAALMCLILAAIGGNIPLVCVAAVGLVAFLTLAGWSFVRLRQR